MNNSTESTPFRQKIRQLKRDNTLLLKLRNMVVHQRDNFGGLNPPVLRALDAWDNRDGDDSGDKLVSE